MQEKKKRRERERERHEAATRGEEHKGIFLRIAPSLESFCSDFAFASLPSGKQDSRAKKKSKRRRAAVIY